MAVALRPGIDVAFDRRRGRRQDHRTLAEIAAHHTHIAPLVVDTIILLVALVVLLIDDDQAEFWVASLQALSHSLIPATICLATD